MDIKQLRRDWEQIVQEYPGLSLVQGENDFFLIGRFDFNAKYNDIPIEDSYSIKIIFHNYPENVPVAVETGNRIQKKLDNHISSDGTMCLGNRLECYESFNHNLSDFMKNLLIPFLYANSFKERYGKYPWKQLAHFSSGTLEYYQERFNLTEKEILTLFQNISKFSTTKGHHPCLCGRSTVFRSCCRSKLEQILNDFYKSQLFYKDASDVLEKTLAKQKFERFFSHHS